jgi:uncharacterized protein (DUF362 family)
MPHSRSDRGRLPEAHVPPSPFRDAVSRREFLGVLTLPFVAAACSRPPYDPSLFHVPAVSSVGVFPAADYTADFQDIVTRGLRELRVDVRGRRVLLKPNMVEYERGSAINTHPLVVVGAALAFRSAGAADVVVGEGPGHRRDMEYLLTHTGLFDHLRENRIRFVDLNHDDVRTVPLRSRFTRMSEVAFSTELLQSDFVVTMPKLKTHHWAGMTACMKNLFGTVPGAVYGWPKNVLHVNGIENSILDLNATLRPGLAIVDAVTAMEGDGPIMGRPRQLGFIGMGTDVVAVDATCARIIGLDPQKIAYLDAASRFLGNIDDRRIQQLGEAPSRYATSFDVVEHFKHLRLRS